MIVKINDYGESGEEYFVEYFVYDLSCNQLNFLNEGLSEECEVDGEILKIKMYFDEKMYPFQSDVAKIRIDDFVAREEIEMNAFLSEFLEDM